jgi:HEAT repeat protein
MRADQALLANFLESGNPEEKSAFAIALGLSGQSRALDPLIKLCQESSHPGMKGHAAIALGLLGDSKAETLLLKQLEAAKRQPVLLERTTIALALIGSEKATSFLLKQIDPGEGITPTLGALAASSRGLALIGNARTAPHLISAMDNKELTPIARAYAAQALGMIADKDSLPWQYKISADLNYLAGMETLIDWETGGGILNRR